MGLPTPEACGLIPHTALRAGRRFAQAASSCKPEGGCQLYAFSTARQGSFFCLFWLPFGPAYRCGPTGWGPLKKPVTSDRIESHQKDQVASGEERQAGFRFGPLSLLLRERTVDGPLRFPS